MNKSPENVVVENENRTYHSYCYDVTEQKPGSVEREASSRLLQLDCFCLPNIITEDILGHKMLLPRTFSATIKVVAEYFRGNK